MLERFKQIGAGLLLVAALAPFVEGQTSRRVKPVSVRPKPVAESSAQIAARASQSRANLISATKSYQESLEKLSALQKSEAEHAADLLRKRREMLELGIISRRDVEAGELVLAEATKKLGETEKLIADAERMVAEVEASELLAKRAVDKPGTLVSSVKLIRYTGTGAWALSSYGTVDAYFRQQFGRPLPLSAYGQSATHDRLGFDHRGALDVAIHPDSAEGQVLMAWLRRQGISFIAFRGAVPGSATGAHIHIGPPSRRVWVRS